MSTTKESRSFLEGLRHYLTSGKGRWVGVKLLLRIAPALYLPFGIINDVIPVLGWIDDLPLSLYVLYIIVQANRHRNPVKYP